MMYRPHTKEAKKSSRHRFNHHGDSRGISVVIVVLVMFMAVLLYAFVKTQNSGETPNYASVLEVQDFVETSHATSLPGWQPNENISMLDFNKVSYRQLFNDSNYVQLAAARKCGIDPSTISNPSTNDGLVYIYSTCLYIVDTMYHSVPYLIPDAANLLRFIAERFQTLMRENYAEKGEYRIIVTSALRTKESERALRRVNRNATDTSCHIYGTTFDLSAQRYRHESGVDTVVDFCKQMLAQTLYELRSEGMCYVKYERGSCFHITVRDGNGLTSVSRTPLPSTKTKTNTITKINTEIKTKTNTNTETNTKIRTKNVSNGRSQKNNSQVIINQTNELTERERLSMEQFEK